MIMMVISAIERHAFSTNGTVGALFGVLLKLNFITVACHADAACLPQAGKHPSPRESLQMLLHG